MSMTPERQNLLPIAEKVEQVLEPGTPLSQSEIHVGLAEMSLEEKTVLAAAYNLEQAEADAAVRAGLDLLASDVASTQATRGGTDLALKPLPPLAGERKLELGLVPASGLGLYLDRDRLGDELGRTLNVYDQVQVQVNAGASQEAWIRPVYGQDGEAAVMLDASTEQWPHSDRLSSIALLRDGRPAVIFPLESQAPDLEYPGDKAGLAKLYIRGAQTPDAYSEVDIEAYVEDAQVAVGQAREALGLDRDFAPAPWLMIDANQRAGHGGWYSSRTEPGADHDGMIYVTGNRFHIGQKTLPPLDRQRVIRHEYMHAVDYWLGDGEMPFSELHREDIALMVNESLSGRRELPKPDKYDTEPPLWLENHAVSQAFSEYYVVGAEVGHASDNIREMMASLLNGVADPDYSNAFAQMSEAQRAKNLACQARIFDMVRARIEEKRHEQKSLT